MEKLLGLFQVAETGLLYYVVAWEVVPMTERQEANGHRAQEESFGHERVDQKESL